VNNDSLKSDGAAFHTKLKLPERPAIIHDYSVTIPSSVDIRSPELFPSVVVSSTPVVVATPLGF
jgi:hypothetical protein